jgi:hypothetical protein
VSNLVDLRSHGRYKPDVMGLACGKVAATKARLGLTDEGFAEELSRLLSWEPSADIVRSWVRAAAAPPGDVLAACDILAPPDPSAVADEIAIAVGEAQTDRASLLAEPASSAIASLWEELHRLAGGPHRAPRDAFRVGRDIRSHALSVAERTRRPTSLADLYLVAGASTALMASAAFDLHRWDAAEALCQSAISYAEITGNNSLLACTLDLPPHWLTGEMNPTLR